MWDAAMPHTSCSWEPVELRILKQELAHLACKCNTCESFKNPSLHNRGYQIDEAVQVEQKNTPHHLLDKYIYAANSDMCEVDNIRTSMMDYLRGDVFCPNCYFIWDLLRKTKRVFKDEGSEMKPKLLDKSTEKTVIFADSATSVTRRPPPPITSDLTLCDYISDTSSGSSLNNRNREVSFEVDHSDRKKSNHDRVKFLDEYPSKEEIYKEPSKFMLQGNCFCLDSFMDSIRPPLDSVI